MPQPTASDPALATSPVSAATINLLRTAGTATICSQLAKRGLHRTFLLGPRPLRPGERMVGVAFTLRYVPFREDIDPGLAYDNEQSLQRLAIERIGPGEVLVIDARGDISAGTLGNILAARVRARGGAGIVTDGAFRDAAQVAAEPFPTFCQAANARLSSSVHHPVEMQTVIGCGGVMVVPGDLVVGDDDGVVVIPRSIAAEIAEAAAAQEGLEDFLLTQIRAGAPLLGTYPPNAAMVASYERRTRDGDKIV